MTWLHSNMALHKCEHPLLDLHTLHAALVSALVEGKKSSDTHPWWDHSLIPGWEHSFFRKLTTTNSNYFFSFHDLNDSTPLNSYKVVFQRIQNPPTNQLTNQPINQPVKNIGGYQCFKMMPYWQLILTKHVWQTSNINRWCQGHREKPRIVSTKIINKTDNSRYVITVKVPERAFLCNQLWGWY